MPLITPPAPTVGPDGKKVYVKVELKLLILDEPAVVQLADVDDTVGEGVVAIGPLKVIRIPPEAPIPPLLLPPPAPPPP
jgi:hypothetical protein